MTMSYDGALVMPSSYAVMDTEEMTYVEGGLGYSWTMRSKAGCLGIATGLKVSGNYSQISTYDIAAEIYTHAMAYYNFSLFLKVASAAGVGVAVNVWGSVSNGIDIENGLDTRRVSGLAYYQVYRAVYAAGPTFI